MALKKWVRVTAPATTANLGPGFDALGMALDLRNLLELKLGTHQTEVHVEGEGNDELPRSGENLVVKAMRLVEETTGRALPPFRLLMRNSIPLARGLGSSAAATVGGIVLASEALQVHLTPEEILALALRLEGHPDNIAPCLVGGLTVAVSENSPQVVRLDPPDVEVTLFIPNVPIATADARAVLPESVPRSDAVFNLGRTALWLAAVTSGKYELLRIACRDRIHQPYRQQLMPYLGDVIEAALSVGAFASFLSGAGSTVAALHSTAVAMDVAGAMAQAAAIHGVQGAVIATRPSTVGVMVESG